PMQRLLIADEVRLGKTIAAAIISLALKTRLEISRVLIVCPSRLTGKWQDELQNRFDERFTIHDAQGMRQLFDDYRRTGPGLQMRAIVSFELLRRREFIDSFSESALPVDLLIVDEAHYLRNEESRTHHLGETLVNLADAVLFLTATPLHLGNKDLFNLLKLLAPEDFNDLHVFDALIAPNEHINRAIKLVATGELRQAGKALEAVEWSTMGPRFKKNPFYVDTLRRLRQADQSTGITDRVEVQWELMQLNTLSGIVSRTRKREFSEGAVRAPVKVLVSFTPEERALYDAVLSQTRREIKQRGNGAPGFASIMKKRQAASCLPALRDRLREARRARGSFVMDVDVSVFDLHHSEDEESGGRPEETLFRLADKLGDTDSKFAQFEQAINRVLHENITSKALVFSFFKGTLRHLEHQLRRLGHDVLVIHGGVPIPERRRLIDAFKNEPEHRIMLSSEVGAEGLDFQFCDVLFNYDLPWNPMQVEQRIGRLDRFGQKSKRIRIYNFVIEETIETRIFQRLYDRIQIFERSIGDLEQILGKEIRELSQEVLQSNLTPAEEDRLATDAAERIVRRQREETELERHQDELLGQGKIFDQRVEGAVATGRYVSGDEIRALVLTFIRKNYPRTVLEFDYEEPCATMELDAALSAHLRRFIETHHLSNRVTDGLQRAMGERRRIPITFDATLARQRPNLEFTTMRHPLAEASIHHWREHAQTGIPSASISVTSSAVDAGEGYFFVYLLSARGISPSVTLEAVVVRDDGEIVEEAGRTLLSHIQSGAAKPLRSERSDASFLDSERRASQWMGRRRDALESDIRRRGAVLLIARETSLQASFEAKIRRTEQLQLEAADDRIRRMRGGQVLRLRERLEHKLAELRGSKDVAVSSKLIAGGRILLHGPASQSR
ncbi:MAG: helicase-related protein, partial [Thermomicrobiales bacterium]